jgi:hypothetical protein
MKRDVHRDNEKDAKPAIIPPGAQALVQYPNFRYLTYCDDNGVWPDCERCEVLLEVMKVLEVFNSRKKVFLGKFFPRSLDFT